jgi:membrane-associated phospholipid phosphatase
MKFRHLLVLFTVLSGASFPTYSDSEDTWDDISNVGVYSLIGTALLLPTVRDDWEGLRQAVYSVGAGAAITLTGKTLIDSERPDESDDDSFPSGHATNAFSSATTLHRRYGWKIGVPAYAVATLTGVARERAREHHWYDVVAGAVIGTATGWFFTDPFNDQVQLIPWADSNGGGVTLSMRW